MIEKCIDENSIQISEVFVDPELTNKKIINNELVDRVPSKGCAIFDIRFTITLPGGSKTKIIINIEASGKAISYDYQAGKGDERYVQLKRWYSRRRYTDR